MITEQEVKTYQKEDPTPNPALSTQPTENM
jgi:hypothetical protein